MEADRPTDADDVATSVREPSSVLTSPPDADIERLDWQERALCAQTDPEAFFPEKGGSTREAKVVCSGCDVRAECLDYALAHDERFGIWGGLSERERRRLRRGEVTVVEQVVTPSRSEPNRRFVDPENLVRGDSRDQVRPAPSTHRIDAAALCADPTEVSG
jgi:WhiB family redox-sensing transcriptional regulator